MNKNITGKNILLIGRDYFFYTKEIVKELEDFYSANVTFYSIEPQQRSYAVLKKIGKAKSVLTDYHNRIIEKEAGKHYDIIFFLQVHQASDHIQNYRTAFPNAFFLLYYWDSVKMHNYLPLVHYFDAVSTFDKKDAEENNFYYLPLFFTENFRELRATATKKYPISFVGTIVNMRRYDQLLKFRQWAKENNLVLYDYSVVSIFNYVKMLIKGRKMKGVHFGSLSRKELEDIYRESETVLDLSNNIQSGYTMRTFETLGAHRKLITTNSNIKNESFYSENNVFVLDESHPYPGTDFLKAAFDNNINIDQYSLRSWINTLFSFCSKKMNY